MTAVWYWYVCSRGRRSFCVLFFSLSCFIRHDSWNECACAHSPVVLTQSVISCRNRRNQFSLLFSWLSTTNFTDGNSSVCVFFLHIPIAAISCIDKYMSMSPCVYCVGMEWIAGWLGINICMCIELKPKLDHEFTVCPENKKKQSQREERIYVYACVMHYAFCAWNRYEAHCNEQ